MERDSKLRAQDPPSGDAAAAPMPPVRVFVRPLHAAQYVDAQLCSPALFDVVLQLAEPSQRVTSAPSPLLHVQRCLHDFAQLERELRQEVKSGDGSTAAGVPPITPAITAYLVSRGDDAMATILYGRDGDALFEARFAWQLELFVSSLIAHSDTTVSCSRALKKFISGGSVSPSSVKKSADDREMIETLLRFHEFHDKGVTPAAAVARERIPSGCTVEHAARVQVAPNNDDERERPASQVVALWRFASQGEHVVFSARFTEKQLQPQQVGGGDGACEDDPYSAADPYKTGEPADPWGGVAEPGLTITLDEGSSMVQYMAQYRTWYSFASGNDTTSPEYEYGYFVASASGDLVLEWENADTTSVLSKPLEFQVCVLPSHLEEEGADVYAGELKKLLLCSDAQEESGSDDAGDGASDGAFWVQRLIAASKITSLDDLLDQRGDDDDEGGDDEDLVFGGLSRLEDAPSNNGIGARDIDRDAKEQLVRLQEEKHFHEQRAKEFEERVAQLEESLVATKKELQKAHDDIAISEEIYKASLEAITQLEVAASVSQQKPSPAVAASALVIPPLLSPSLRTVEAETKEECEAAPPSSSSSSSVTENEHQRVVNLCTTFQEQCLWRSIELAESEKRNMALEGKLHDTEQEKTELHTQIAAREEKIASLQAENRKLRTHKSILVQEVKKLQPYSQINLAVLVQEAQEARMMQRSLQVQLDSRNVIDNAVTPSSITSSPVATEEDGAGGGFVVIESEDHSSI